MVNDPDIILADEPTGALDTQNGERIIDLLCAMSARGKTIVIVTHDERVADRCASVVRLTDGIVT